MRELAIFMVLCVLLASVPSCTTNESLKVQNIYPSSLTQFPPGSTVSKMEVMEDGQVQYEIILPDGTYQSVAGTGNTGNFTAIFNQNDGTEQTAKGQIEADVSPTLTGQGNATGGDKSKEGGQTMTGNDGSEEAVKPPEVDG